ncbi:MAG: alpha-galactosidase [Chakrabartia sp.]
MTQTLSQCRVDGAGRTLVFDLRAGCVQLSYAGSALPKTENLLMLCDAQIRGRHESQPDAPVPASLLMQSGFGYAGTPSIALSRVGHNLPTSFVLTGVEQENHLITFRFEDAGIGARLTIHWKIAVSGLVITQTEIENFGTADFSVDQLASLTLPLPHWATQIVRNTGRWASEMQEIRTPLSNGSFGGASHGGRPGFGGALWARFEEVATAEQSGRALGAHLAWSGDHFLTIEQDSEGCGVMLMGPRLDRGEMIIAPGHKQSMPKAMFSISDQGRFQVRTAFHSYVTEEISPAKGPRKVHLNSWEALVFDMTEECLFRLARDAASLGVERFVLDDGWFKGRRDDTSSLGDWTVDAGLFPNGLTPLIEHVHASGMDFGLWVEPEMVNPDSDLYRAHPDWCLHAPRAARPTQRNQLVLDLTQADVADYLFASIDALLSDHKIAYLKWDHNRDLFPLAGKGYAQTQALYALTDRLRANHPDVEIETCASGGGRVDFEMLRRCSRFWASDNNDAIERLSINKGWFNFLPLMVTGNHVGPSPNPITGRQINIDFRAKVAMFGHMGVEVDPGSLSQSERDILSAHIEIYKAWRHVLHEGHLHEINHNDPGLYGWFALRGQTGLALIAQIGFARNFNVAPITLPGLVADASYRVKCLEPWSTKAARYVANANLWREGVVMTGHALAMSGLALPLTHPETAWLLSVEPS